MHIIHVASELAPIAKIGGLADVVMGLSSELSWEGHDVDIIIPKYDCLDADKVRDLHIEKSEVEVAYDGAVYKNTIWVGWVENIKVYFIDTQHPKLFFSRGCIYGCEDDLDRFLYFSKVTLELLLQNGMNPDILHLHDWHTAVIALLLKEIFQPLGLEKTKVMYTIHNLQYQGEAPKEYLDKLGLKGGELVSNGELNQNPDSINLMKAGILYSDAINAVSQTYAKEIQTEEMGKGLHQLLQKHQGKLFGIVNGVDYHYWNPETDPYLPAHFSSREEPKDDYDRNTLDRKGFVKKVLREKLMLDEAHRPIVGCITRLVPQKGVHLIRHALYYTLEKGGQFALLGSSPIPSINKEFHDLMHEFSDHPHARIILKHEEELAHFIYGGADIFIVPSIFEPCGLTQMISLRYGTIPIVRKTGGLQDTILDVDDQSVPHEKRNGFVFDEPTPEAFSTAIDRAMGLWFDKPAEWRELMKRAIDMDFSWKGPAQEYVKVYNWMKNSIDNS